MRQGGTAPGAKAEGFPGGRSGAAFEYLRLPRLCLRIAPDGRVGNGLHLDRPLGNVLEQSLKDILQGIAMFELRAEAGD
ncbi:MAG: hypothetical protein KBD56_09005 [Candidatus Eisenbacteria bacterium]|nr:hypothetical protein [Candidatus Eisenbacteria bacterium]